MMDLLLTHGYFLYDDPAERRIMKPYPALGILYITAYLRARGFDVSVHDNTFGDKEQFKAMITASRPPVVGFYVNLMTKLNVVELLPWCKQHGSKVVVGGPDVQEYAAEYLEHGADVVVLGEGEETMAELLPALQAARSLADVAGIAYRNDDGEVVRTMPRPLIQDLDSLPFPARDAIDMHAYVDTWRKHHGRGSVSLICARGCPFTCTWCSRSVFGDSHRRRSPAGVVDEIELLRDQYKPDMLWFADDVFTINHAWFHAFYDEMKRRNIRIPFECISRADRLNEDILRKMADIGSFRIWYGSESGSQRILDAMERRVTTEKIQTITHQAQKFGIEAGLFVMLGYPGEEIGDIEETVSHLKKANPDLFLTTVAYPIKGTAFYKSAADTIREEADWAHSTDRQLSLRGRHSDKFYWYANRYVVNEVRHHRLSQQSGNGFLDRASAFVKAKAARIGMELTKSQRS